MTICELSFRRRRSFHIWQIEKAELGGGSSRKKNPINLGARLLGPLNCYVPRKEERPTPKPIHAYARKEKKNGYRRYEAISPQVQMPVSHLDEVCGECAEFTVRVLPEKQIR